MPPRSLPPWRAAVSGGAVRTRAAGGPLRRAAAPPALSARPFFPASASASAPRCQPSFSRPLHSGPAASSAPLPSPHAHSEPDSTATPSTSLLRDPFAHADTAFSEKKRDELKLRGLLPPAQQSLDVQILRALEQIRVKKTDREWGRDADRAPMRTPS
jgi:hypothetical protein